ncbi:30S ribosomal protein s1 homolog b [Phtheirospermum japonicum]|uniref:30S ribosomal protein s1 homolog b n=1 Tax=Phtheirospermum japonicum TaxID=374723 RepID=A0A830CWE4_9LAMI|nr:30S ribosomal protein s1 homolog b [Phtheirospermum japonicum]
MPTLTHLTCNIIKPPFFSPFVPFTIHTLSTPFAKTFKSRNICFSCKLFNFDEPLSHFAVKTGSLRSLMTPFCPKGGDSEEPEELELLLKKPSPKQLDNGVVEEIEEDETKNPDEDEILEPFYKFFRPFQEEMNQTQISVEEENEKDLLGTMLTKEVLPLYDKEIDYLLCDFEKNAEEFLVPGKIKQLNEPIEIIITEWNTGGLLTRIEGLRAFLPKAELMNRINNYTELKENVGRRIRVQITRLNEETNDLILSEKEAWEMMNLLEGTLLEGTVRKVFPYGAQIRISDTNRSIAELESEPGLFLSNKGKVFSEAKEMAKKYRRKISAFSAKKKLEALPMNGLPFEDEERLYANWKWFKFERDGP